MRFQNIRNKNMTFISSIYSHMNYCTNMMTFLIGNSKAFH